MDITVAWWVTWVLGALPLLIGVIWWWNDLYYMVTLRARCSATGTKLPPGYMGIPFLGELPTFLWYFKVLRRPDDFINSNCHSYGDRVGMYRTHLFGFPSIIACSPAITKFIFRSDDQFPYRWPTNDLVGHNSIISASGQRHDRFSRFLSIAINQPEALRRIATHVQPRIAAALQAWAEKGTVVAYDEVKKVTFENIGKLFASIEPGPLLDSLGYNFEGMVKGMRAQPFNMCRRKLEAIFRKELEKRKHDQNGSETAGDLMDGLMKLKDEEGEKLSNEEVIDNMASLVVGGFESTVRSSMWAIYYLAKFPNVLHKLREENNNILREKKGEFLTRDDVSQLKYTNKVAEEAIRLANVSAFVFRSGDKDVEYKGYKIPKGWKVICWLRYIHTDPDNFDDPMCFNPDRWDKPAGAFLAFGGGSRICVGNMLARMQLALLIHHLAVGYKWELINPDG